MTPAIITAVALATLPGARAPRELVSLVCAAEGCRHDDVGPIVGLMQINLRWARPGRLCAGMRLREPWDSVECACRLLRYGFDVCSPSVSSGKRLATSSGGNTNGWLLALGHYHTGRCTEDGYARRIMERWRKHERRSTS